MYPRRANSKLILDPFGLAAAGKRITKVRRILFNDELVQQLRPVLCVLRVVGVLPITCRRSGEVLNITYRFKYHMQAFRLSVEYNLQV